MSVFEYVLAFLTLVLGLGLTKNLTAISELEFAEKREQNLLDLTWLISIILLQVDYWIVMWSRHGTQEAWPLWQLLLMLTFAIVLYMAGAYVAQASQAEGEGRWRKLRFGFVTLIVWAVGASLNAVLILNVGTFSSILGPYVAVIMLVAGLFSESRPMLFRIATFGFLAFAVHLAGFAGPTTIG